MRELILHNEEDTREFARETAARLGPDDVIGLVGELGTGKTTLTKYIAEALGVTGLVTSPTFTIIQEYRSGVLPLFHFDVYRLGSAEELLAVGGDEYFYAGGVSVIEWADKVAGILPDETKYIMISYGESEGERIVRCTF